MFITFEGIEGSGKSTAMTALAAHLQKNGHEVLCTREPGGSALGQTLRATLLDTRTHNLHSHAELFLFLADRAQHVHEVIQPALCAGKIVLCDRYTDSTIAYQGNARGMDKDQLRTVNTIATGGLVPHLTLLFDLPVDIGLQRALQRNAAQGTQASEGRFDAESSRFHELVRQGYLELGTAEPQRIVRIDANQTQQAVFLQCIAAINSRHLLFPQV